MPRLLSVIATSLQASTRAALRKQLDSLPFVECFGIVDALGDAHALTVDQPPDVILVDLTGRELDGGLFIQTLSMDEQQPFVLFALHQAMDAGMILQCARQGAKEFIPYPADAVALSDSLRRLDTILARAAKPGLSESASQALDQASGQASPCQIITTFSPKGGSGCTTVALNLAHELRRLTQAPTLLLDMDQLYNNTAVLLNIKPNLCLADLLGNGQKTDHLDPAMLAGLITQHESGVHVLAASKNVLDEHDLLPPELLPLIVQFARQQYRYLVVDLPSHSVDPYHQFWVEQAQSALVVSRLDIPALYRTRQYLELVGPHLPADRLKLVLNRSDLKAAVGLSNQEVEAQFRVPVFASLSNDWELNVEANSLGRLFTTIKPQSELARQMDALARRVAGLEPANDAMKILATGEDRGKATAGGFQGLLNRFMKSGKGTPPLPPALGKASSSMTVE